MKEELVLKERKDINTKKWEVENRDNPIPLWYTSGRIWWKVEDNRVGGKELLIVWSDKRCRKIYGQLWYVLKDKNCTEALAGKMMVNKVSERPWTYLIVDFEGCDSSSLW